jgi:hypothetical protein
VQTLQEQNAEDENAIKAKEAVAKKLDLELDALAGVPATTSTSTSAHHHHHRATAPSASSSSSSVVATRAAASGGEEKAGEVVTSAADDVAPAADGQPTRGAKKSGRSRYERRSSPHYNAAKSNREKEKVEKDHKEKGEGGGGSGIKAEKDHKEKEDKRKTLAEEKATEEEESGKLASFLKPGKKRERSVRQKRLSERADHIAATTKGGNSD